MRLIEMAAYFLFVLYLRFYVSGVSYMYLSSPFRPIPIAVVLYLRLLRMLTYFPYKLPSYL